MAWCYEEQLFNEPYEGFFEILTTGAEKKGGKGRGKKAGGIGTGTGIPERTALLPMRSSPGQPYSRDAEGQEVKRIQEARRKVEEQTRVQGLVLKEKEARLAALRS